MNHLLRGLAPISDAGWAEIEEEAARTLRDYLGGRKVVDFSGPHGWHHSAEATGRVEAAADADEGVSAAIRQVAPLVELRTDFSLPIDVLRAIDRGAEDADLDPVVDAARRLARAEDGLVFGGYAPAGIVGLASGSDHEPIDIDPDYTNFPEKVALAISRLRTAGVAGPFGIALGPQCYTGVMEATDSGYPVIRHLRVLVEGPVVWAPGLDGAAVVSMRGGDFQLVCGQDLSIGYTSHDAGAVQLYLEESVTFRNLTPEAAVALVHPSKGSKKRAAKKR